MSERWGTGPQCVTDIWFIIGAWSTRLCQLYHNVCLQAGAVGYILCENLAIHARAYLSYHMAGYRVQGAGISSGVSEVN